MHKITGKKTIFKDIKKQKIYSKRYHYHLNINFPRIPSSYNSAFLSLMRAIGNTFPLLKYQLFCILLLLIKISSKLKSLLTGFCSCYRPTGTCRVSPYRGLGEELFWIKADDPFIDSSGRYRDIFFKTLLSLKNFYKNGVWTFCYFGSNK